MKLAPIYYRQVWPQRNGWVMAGLFSIVVIVIAARGRLCSARRDGTHPETFSEVPPRVRRLVDTLREAQRTPSVAAWALASTAIDARARCVAKPEPCAKCA
jgi:hypothetical protein